jgi:hypothetical protein
MRAAFDHRLDPSLVERLDGEAADLSGAKAGGSNEMELAVCIEQPECGHLDREHGSESVGDLLERKHQVLAANGGDRLLESDPPPLALLEEMPGVDLIGELDGKRDHDRSPTVRVDPVEAGAPPARSTPDDVVTELGQVTRPPGHGDLFEE